MVDMMNKWHDPLCRRCPRLVHYLELVRADNPQYFCQPVPPFGDPQATLLVVGLAPGKHGANATGRPFTGDHAGRLLYQMLYEFGYSSAPSSNPGDNLVLSGCRITNAVKCLPPENKPIAREINACRDYLVNELRAIPVGGVVLALGRLAHDSVIRAESEKIKDQPFRHAETYELAGNRHLVSSYHCSRYNTQTRRLTEAMFREVFRIVRQLVDQANAT